MWPSAYSSKAGLKLTKVGAQELSFGIRGAGILLEKQKDEN